MGAVSAAGDLNGDGFDDLIIGAFFADPNGSYSGSSYVVFGGIDGPGLVPALGLTPTSINFGNVPVGTPSAAQTVTAQNTGTGNLIFGTLAVSGANAGDFALSNDLCSGQVVAAAATCTFDIILTPGASGPRAAQVDLPSNAPSSPDALPLTGTGITQPAVAITPTSVDFGNVPVGTPSAAQTVTAQNTGTANLIFGTLAVSGANAGDFALSNDLCSGQVVAAAATCTFDIILTPGASGPRAAQVDLPSNAPSSPDALPLTGTGGQVLPVPTLGRFGLLLLGAMIALLGSLAVLRGRLVQRHRDTAG